MSRFITLALSRAAARGWTAALSICAITVSGCAQTPHSASTVAPPVLRTALIPASCSKPVYPPQALARKIEGTSIIQFLLSAQGKVLESRVQKSSGDASLDEAVRSAMSACRFTPPMHQGEPVQAWTSLEYVWKAD
ncbi:energy transducer TonB [Massilia sp.]|uniref:energy transducer TonB n=1 Tax=Massilia sp. TaxID=1882437 RepID=UPI00289AACC7|nr:energy transducer TonB [Massilia sp.]